MEQKKIENLPKGFFIHLGVEETELDLIPSEEVSLPAEQVKELSYLAKIGLLSPYSADLVLGSMDRFGKTLVKGRNLKTFWLRFGDEENLITVTSYARQFLTIEVGNDILGLYDYATEVFKAASKLFANQNEKLTFPALARFGTIYSWERMKPAGWLNRVFYSPEDIVALSRVDIASNRLLGFMRQHTSVEDIMLFADLPDSWLGEVLSFDEISYEDL